MAMVNKVGHSFYGEYWVYKIRSIGGVHQAYKTVTFLRVKNKPIRSIISTLRAYQEVYKVCQNY